jgi:2-phospho-L-lactate/phosphoenolpyruvate guanylyltransferase
MSGWTAIVPIKPAAERKTRLRELLGEAERATLAERMLAHVLTTLCAAPTIADVTVLASELPEGWTGRWILDLGRGLNPELDDACHAIPRQVVIIHADLPLLSIDDVRALTAAAARGVAIAPDRHDIGTNAIALAETATFRFAFGPDSLSRHVAAAGARGALVRRTGLAFDIDTPDDLAPARAAGDRP